MRVFLFTFSKMSEKFSRFISEKIDNDTNIIWFEKSNKYIIVNDLSNNLILNKIDPDKYPINQELLKQNQISSDALVNINNDIHNLLLECNLKIDNENLEVSPTFEKEYIHQSKFKFNDRVVKIEYSDEKLRSVIDPKFNHLSCDDKEEVTYKVTESNKKIYLSKNQKFLGSWNANQMHEFQGKVSMELTSFFHGMNDSDWTAVFHGSTLFKKNKGLMLTGDSGNGKSSLSVILIAENFSLVADDFSPFDNSGYHYNFPSAISVKEGFYNTANKLFNSFVELKEYYISDIKGNVKYLPRNIQNQLILKTKCNVIINVKFGPTLKNEIKEINKGSALKKILPDAWISNENRHANSFINWVKSSTFYDLTYNDNKKAIQMINEIL